MLHAILLEAGHQAGLYTSPHLVTALERVRLGTREWTEAELVSTMNTALDVIWNDPQLKNDPPTIFDLITAASFLAIAQARLPVAVIEVGLGGRLDSTNVCNPVVSIITSIGLDHQSYLGPNLLDIAREKAGIIKPRVPLISTATQPEIQRLFQQMALDAGACCYLGGRNFDYVKTHGMHSGHDLFDYLGIQARWPDMPLPLPGEHQFRNAAAACAGAELLTHNGFRISQDHVKNGLLKVLWPGRLEHVSTIPDLWLDGAHNPDGANALAAFIRDKLPKDRKVHLILGFKADKNFSEFLGIVAPLAHRLTLTAISGLLPVSEIESTAHRFHSNVVVEPDFSRIMSQLFWRKNPDEQVIVTGSLYLVGAAKRWLRDNLSAH